MSGTVLAVKDVVMIKAKRMILNVPSLELKRGEVLALMGHNGAGKSTLLQVLALLQKPTKGEVYFCGQVVRRQDKLRVRRKMAAVLQEPLLLDTTVFKNVAVGLQLRNYPKSEINRLVNSWLDRVGILHLAKQPVHTLSGGEAQRVSLARALVLDPQVLFLDEPFSALDTPTKESLLDDLREILEENRITAVFVTHDYREIPKLADRVIELANGDIIQEGLPDEVLAGKLYQEQKVSYINDKITG